MSTEIWVLKILQSRFKIRTYFLMAGIYIFIPPEVGSMRFMPTTIT